MSLKIVIASAGLALAAAIGCSVAFAAPSYGWDRTYYSDASMTVVVGEGAKGCSGKPAIMLWGVATRYFTSDLQPCG